MTLSRLVLRNLTFYWRTNIPIIAGVATAIAVLSGALLVGQSVRESLRRLLFERIGATEHLLSADHYFSEGLAASPAGGSTACPIISLKGILTAERSGISVHDVNVYGVDDRFWKFQNLKNRAFPGGRAGLVGDALAKQLGTAPGDALLLRVEKQQAIPREWLYGRRDDVGKTMRLDSADIVPTDCLGEFSLYPVQGKVYSVFVPLKRLQKELDQPERVNTVLWRTQPKSAESILAALEKRLSLQDLDLKLRFTPARKAFSLESGRILLDDSIARAAAQSAAETGMAVSPVYSYLANSIRANSREIPYSVITAADLETGALTSIGKVQSASIPSVDLKDAESIWITDWAWRDLGISEGDPLEVDYYVWHEEGQLMTRTARFRLAGVLSTAGDVDTALVPEIPGITGARSLGDWDPPFPLDLRRIRPEDETYWDRYRTTPKAFLTLARGQELWANRFGKLTGLRIKPPDGMSPEQGRRQFEQALLRNLDLNQAGFVLNAVREQGLAASRGSTDFGEYFAYFSSFLIAAAILLAALFFRLMTEQRAKEIGILRTAGFPANKIRRVFLLEGWILSTAGSLLGILGAVVYGRILMLGLRTWWVGAVGTQRLYLHISYRDLAAGAVAGMIFSLATIAWTLRDLGRSSPRTLLTGVLESAARRKGRIRVFGAASIFGSLAAVVFLVTSLLGKMPLVEGFFGAGFLLLLSILSATAIYLRSNRSGLLRGSGWPAFFRFGLKNAMHRPGRSLLCASLIASATFIVVSMEAFRHNPEGVSLNSKSGTGGYPLIAESAFPVLYDLSSTAGLEALGLSPSQVPAISQVRFVPFRERPGDDASCLNLYAPREPRILGVSRSFVSADRFSFQKSLTATPAEEENPWLLLESSFQDPVIPAIADANTIQYILHLSVGSELAVRGNKGNPVRLRLVAALKDSIFQGKLLISESNFLRVFPEHEGYRFFLLDSPPAAAATLAAQLKQALADYGVRLESSQERLKAFHRVENTYLSTFQSLGALGLILGTIGLAAVLLRNVLERRQELALMRAVGYRRGILAAIVLSENLVLLSWGLASGMICALLAITPALIARGESFPFLTAGSILLSVLAAGMISSLWAVIAAIRSPLLAALRSE